MKPIPTFPRHDDYEDQFLLKPAGLRDTHSEGKVKDRVRNGDKFTHLNDLMAEREGFEPPIAFRLCLISSLLYLLIIVNVYAPFASMTSAGVTFGVTFRVRFVSAWVTGWW